MRALLILLLCQVLGWAGDLSGIVKYTEGSLPEHDLGQSRTLSLIRKNDNQLRWHLAWKPDTNSERSVTSGEGIGPEEKSAYFWDEATQTLWYSTPRVIVKLTILSKSSSESLHRPTECYQKYTDLPPVFRADIEKILGDTDTPMG